MVWIGIVWDIFIRTLKGFFGTDKPLVTEVQNAKPEIPLPVKSDAELLADLGMRLDDRTKDERDLHDRSSGEAATNP